MEPSVVLGACPLHANLQSIVLLVALKTVRVHVVSDAAVSSRNIHLWAGMSCGVMQRVLVEAGWIFPPVTLWLLSFHRPGCALRVGGLAQKPTLMSQRVPPLVRQVFNASIWACWLLRAWLAAQILSVPTARAAQAFEKLMTTTQPSPLFLQLESAL